MMNQAGTAPHRRSMRRQRWSQDGSAMSLMAQANGGSVLLHKEEESSWVQHQEDEEERRGVSLTIALWGRWWKAEHRAGEVLCAALKGKREDAEREKSWRLHAAVAVILYKPFLVVSTADWRAWWWWWWGWGWRWDAM
jgi:hypothetical protein